MRRVLVAATVAALALAGCDGADQQSAAPEKSSASASDGGAKESPSATGDADRGDAIDVEIEGDEVEPNGERAQVAVGKPIRLRVESDRAAELHVHSSPEQELEVRKGESTVTFKVMTPGIVEVEEHHSGVVILQLEVS